MDGRGPAPLVRWIDPRSQAGQAIAIVALIMLVLLGMVGLALDAGVAMFRNQDAEHAAAAGALSGVIFMPNAFAPGSGTSPGLDAVDRAVAETGRNGFTTTTLAPSGKAYIATNPSSGITVTVAPTTTREQLQVTVTTAVPTSFMRLFGISSMTVSRTAVAGYLAPIALGQPGTQIGSTVSQLGGTGFYFLRSEGWSTDRHQGDAYTPNPGSSTDVHAISAIAGDESGSAPTAPVPARGGYNFQVYLPSGGQVQVYNAAFAPDSNPAVTGNPGHNNCENVEPLWSTCNPNGSNYFLHEDDPDFSWTATPLNQQFAAMRYTVFQVSNLFQRASDVPVSQVTVYPIDATSWKTNTFLDINKLDKSGKFTRFTQSACVGSGTNLGIYHAWIDVLAPGACAAGAEPSLLAVNQACTLCSSGSLPAGTYRLRVDLLSYDGSLPPGGSRAHKAVAVQVSGPSGCAGCVLGAWNDMAFYTPVSGTNFTLPIFQLPPSYAGETIDVDIYDPGDINANGGSAYMSILDAATGVSAQNVTLTDLGSSRQDPPGVVPTCSFSGGQASNPPCQVPPSGGLCTSPGSGCFVSNAGGNDHFNGQWVRVEIPVEGNYDKLLSGTPPSAWYWKLQYLTTASVQATDTVTLTVNLRGAPAHLLSS